MSNYHSMLVVILMDRSDELLLCGFLMKKDDELEKIKNTLRGLRQSYNGQTDSVNYPFFSLKLVFRILKIYTLLFLFIKSYTFEPVHFLQYLVVEI